MYCNHCGEKVRNESQNFCMYCGKKLFKPKKNIEEKTKDVLSIQEESKFDKSNTYKNTPKDNIIEEISAKEIEESPYRNKVLQQWSKDEIGKREKIEKIKCYLKKYYIYIIIFISIILLIFISLQINDNKNILIKKDSNVQDIIIPKQLLNLIDTNKH